MSKKRTIKKFIKLCSVNRSDNINIILFADKCYKRDIIYYINEQNRSRRSKKCGAFL